MPLIDDLDEAPAPAPPRAPDPGAFESFKGGLYNLPVKDDQHWIARSMGEGLRIPATAAKGLTLTGPWGLVHDAEKITRGVLREALGSQTADKLMMDLGFSGAEEAAARRAAKDKELRAPGISTMGLGPVEPKTIPEHVANSLGEFPVRTLPKLSAATAAAGGNSVGGFSLLGGLEAMGEGANFTEAIPEALKGGATGAVLHASNALAPMSRAVVQSGTMALPVMQAGGSATDVARAGAEGAAFSLLGGRGGVTTGELAKRGRNLVREGKAVPGNAGYRQMAPGEELPPISVDEPVPPPPEPPPAKPVASTSPPKAANPPDYTRKLIPPDPKDLSTVDKAIHTAFRKDEALSSEIRASVDAYGLRKQDFLRALEKKFGGKKGYRPDENTQLKVFLAGRVPYLVGKVDGQPVRLLGDDMLNRMAELAGAPKLYDGTPNTIQRGGYWGSPFPEDNEPEPLGQWLRRGLVPPEIKADYYYLQTWVPSKEAPPVPEPIQPPEFTVTGFKPGSVQPRQKFPPEPSLEEYGPYPVDDGFGTIEYGNPAPLSEQSKREQAYQRWVNGDRSAARPGAMPFSLLGPYAEEPPKATTNKFYSALRDRKDRDEGWQRWVDGEGPPVSEPSRSAPMEDTSAPGNWADDGTIVDTGNPVEPQPLPPAPSVEQVVQAPPDPNTGRPSLSAPNGSEYTLLPASEISADPTRFQYKRTGKAGITSKFSDSEVFNPNVAGALSVWRDPEDGRYYVVNGHHRLEIAQRTGYEAPLVVRVMNASSAEEAKAVGAIENIAEGNGTLLDAANVFRQYGWDRAEMRRNGLAFSNKMIADSANLASLDAPLFNRVTLGIWSDTRGAIVGSANLDPKRQEAVATAIDKADADRKAPISDGAVAELVEWAKTSTLQERPKKNNQQGTIGDPGPLLFANLADKAELSKQVKDILKTALRTTRSANKNADTLELLDNQINREGNAATGTAAEQVISAYNKLAYQKGELGELLQRGADRVSKGESVETVASDIIDQVVQAIKKQLPSIDVGPLEGITKRRAGGAGKKARELFDPVPEAPAPPEAVESPAPAPPEAVESPAPPPAKKVAGPTSTSSPGWGNRLRELGYPPEKLNYTLSFTGADGTQNVYLPDETKPIGTIQRIGKGDAVAWGHSLLDRPEDRFASPKKAAYDLVVRTLLKRGEKLKSPEPATTDWTRELPERLGLSPSSPSWAQSGSAREDVLNALRQGDVAPGNLHPSTAASLFGSPKMHTVVERHVIMGRNNDPRAVVTKSLLPRLRKNLRDDIKADLTDIPGLDVSSKLSSDLEWVRDVYTKYFGWKSPEPPPSPGSTEPGGQAKPYPGKVKKTTRKGSPDMRLFVPEGEGFTSEVEIHTPDGLAHTYEVTGISADGSPLSERELRRRAYDMHREVLEAEARGRREEKVGDQVTTAMEADPDPRLREATAGRPMGDADLRAVLAENGVDPDNIEDFRRVFNVDRPRDGVAEGQTYIDRREDQFVLPPRISELSYRHEEPTLDLVADGWVATFPGQPEDGPLGPGLYVHSSKNAATELAPLVSESRVSVYYPAIIRSEADFVNLLRDAGIRPWKDVVEASRDLPKLREWMETRGGFDGVVLKLDEASKASDTVRLAFRSAEDQIIDFKTRPRVEERVLPEAPRGMPEDVALSRLTPAEVESARNSPDAQRATYLINRTDFSGAIDEVRPQDLVVYRRRRINYGTNVPPPGQAPPGRPGGANMSSTGVDAGQMVTRTQIAQKLGERIDAVFVRGKVNQRSLNIPPGVLVSGWYKWFAGYGRVHSMQDIGTLAHEYGHALESLLFSQLGPGKTRGRPDPSNWVPWAAELDPIASASLRGGRPTHEGFAEFVRYYVTNRTYAETVAPKFFKFFEQQMGQEAPEILETLQSAGDKFQVFWNEMSPSQRALAAMGTGVSTRRGLGGFSQFIETSLNDTLTKFLDRHHPLKVAVNGTFGREQRNWYGKRIPYSNVMASENPAILAQTLSQHTAGVVNNFLRGAGQLDARGNVIGPTLENIFSPYHNRPEAIDKWVAYAFARRTLELYKKKPGIELPLTAMDAQVIIRDTELSDPHASPTFDLQRQYSSNLLNYLVENGVLSRDGADKIDILNQDYVPMYAVLDAMERSQEAGGQGPSRASVGQIYNPIRQLNGGDVPRINPVEGLIKNTVMFIGLAHRNEVAQALYKMGLKEGGGKFVRHVDPKMAATTVDPDEVKSWIRKHMSPVLQKALEQASGARLKDVLDTIVPSELLTVFRKTKYHPSEPILTAFFGGKEKHMEVNPDIYNTMMGLPRALRNKFVALLALPAVAQRLGATGANVEFSFKNLPRDQMFGFLVSKYGNLPFVNAVTGAYHLLSPNSTYKESFFKQGLGGVGLASVGTDQLQKEADVTLRYSRKEQRWQQDPMWKRLPQQAASLAKVPFSFAIDTVRDISNWFETVSRLGAFVDARKFEERRGFVPGTSSIDASGKVTGPTGLTSATVPNPAQLTRELELRSNMAARTSTVDFTVMGSDPQWQSYAMLTAFMNPALQGTATAVRAIESNPVGVLARTAMAVTIPTILAALWGKDDGQVADADERTKQSFWLLPTRPIDKKVFQEWQLKDPARAAEWVRSFPLVRIPKPEFFGQVGGTLVEPLIDAIITEDFEGNAAKFKRYAWRFFKDDLLITKEPTFAAAPLDILRNEDPWTGKPIVPLTLQNATIDPAEKSTVDTSPSVVAATRVMNNTFGTEVSPLQSQYLLRSWGASVGRQLLDVADYGFEKTYGKSEKAVSNPPESDWRSLWGIRSFLVRYPTVSAQPIQNFYELYNKVKVAHDTSRYVQTAEPDRALLVAAENPEGLLFSRMEEQRKELTEINKKLREVYKAPNMDGKSKRRALDGLTMYFISKARTFHEQSTEMLKQIEARKETPVVSLEPDQAASGY